MYSFRDTYFDLVNSTETGTISARISGVWGDLDSARDLPLTWHTANPGMDWEYFRINPGVDTFMRPVGDGTFELFVLVRILTGYGGGSQ